jgi:ribosomal protein S18 acetylase RimI-like enzyme
MRRAVEIREIRPDDMRDVFLLGSESFSRQDGTDTVPPWNETNLAGVLSEDSSRSFVAAGKKSIDGFLIARINAPERAEILWTAVRGPEAYRVREDLYRAFRESLPGTVSIIRVAVPGSNSEMIDFFGKFGFTDSEHVVIMENFFRKNT